jgi:hypothetical protein
MKTQIFAVAIMFALTSAAPVTTSAGEIAPSPDELFSVFSASRDGARSGRIVDPKFFSRVRLEKALRFADGLIEDTQVPGFDMTREGLLDVLSVVGVEAVYSYGISSMAGDSVALRMQVSLDGRPVLLTIGFQMEAGLWRMNNTLIDFSGDWYQSNLKPVRTWPRLLPRKSPWVEVSGN